MSAAPQEPAAPRPLTATAMSGGLWTGMQVVANKAVSLLGTLVTMYLLVPEQFGIAQVALSILSYAVILPAFTLSDVLLSRPAEAERLMGTAVRLCTAVSLPTMALLAGAGWWVAGHYEQPALVSACLVVALRPLADLLLLAPQTRLRVRLEFRRMAQIDAVTQTLATLGTIAMAALGGGYVSLLLPQILFTAVRAALYARGARPEAGQERSAWLPSEWRPLLKGYWLSGLGQYTHGALVMAPPLLIAQFADETHVGWYSSAFSLSASVNTVVAVSIGLVLQPIFAQMAGDRQRQGAAFLRACSAISAVSMPLCLCQAALLGPAFRCFLPAKWEGAILLGQMLSAGQALYFSVNPAMGLLKAQGNFGAFLAWQLAQLVLVVAAMWVAGRWGGEQATAWIVGVYAFYHVVSSPVGVWLCVRGTHHIGRSLAAIFVVPMIAALAAVAPAYFALGMLLPPGRTTDLATIAAVPLVAMAAYPWLLRRLAPQTHGECMTMLRAVRAKLAGRAAA